MAAEIRRTHEVTCAHRIRARLLARAGDPAEPGPALCRQIAAEIQACCGHTRLKSFRLAYGWTVAAAVERFHAMCARERLRPRGLTTRSWRQWEAGGRPDRDYEDLLCRLFATGPVQLGFAADYSPPVPGDPGAAPSAPSSSGSSGALSRISGPAVPAGCGAVGSGGVSPSAAPVAYRRTDESGTDEMTAEVVTMAAHEGSERAEQAERRDIGEATLEQIRADVIGVAHAYVTGEPFLLFQEMRRIRARIFSVLDRRLWPRDETELYFLLGGLSGLMSQAAQDLGYAQAAEELVRAGWAYAVAIDHRPLMGFLRGRLSCLAYWGDRPRHSRDLARQGLEYVADGQGAARLHLLDAQASARLGDAPAARAAIAAASDARARERRDDLYDEIGGQFGFTPAKQHYLAGSALVELPDAEPDAIGELGRALDGFRSGPPAERSYGCEAIAAINLAQAQLRTGQLDAVDLDPVLSLPPNKRIDALPRRLGGVRAQLAAPRYRGTAAAAELDERIEAFCRETAHGLAALPASG